MDRDPDVLIGIEADLNKVIAAPERAELFAPAWRELVVKADISRLIVLKALDPDARCLGDLFVDLAVGYWDAAFDAAVDRGIFPARSPASNVVFTAIMPQPMSTPTAAGMTASSGCQDGPHRGAFSIAGIRHDCHRAVQKRDRGRVLNLLSRLGLDVLWRYEGDDPVAILNIDFLTGTSAIVS